MHPSTTERVAEDELRDALTVGVWRDTMIGMDGIVNKAPLGYLVGQMTTVPTSLRRPPHA